MKHTLLLLTLCLMTFASCTDDGWIDNNGALNQGGNETVNQGSYSQMRIVGDYLYGLNENLLTTVSLRNQDEPVIIDQQELLFDTESIFHHEGILYIGSRTRMYIFSINSEGIPEIRSTTNHFLGEADFICNSDPIVANSRTAFVTLNSNNVQFEACFLRPQTNQLRIYNIENINRPDHLQTVQMQDPKGLGLDGDHLFVCDGRNGLMVFDVSNRVEPRVIHHFPGYNVHDVIVDNGNLLVITNSQLLQYDYSDMETMHLKNTINL